MFFWLKWWFFNSFMLMLNLILVGIENSFFKGFFRIGVIVNIVLLLRFGVVFDVFS